MKSLVRTALPTESTAFLQANSDAYEWLIGKKPAINRWDGGKAILRWVEKAAYFAGKFHPGRFADGALENVALEIGAELDTFATSTQGFTIPVAHGGSYRRVLHVASNVFGIGGHTRMLYHHVRNDQSSRHSLVLMDQGKIPLPPWLSEAIASSDGNLVVFPSGSSHCQKASWLREMALRYADLVLLHHGFYDIVPTLAFATRECPPVAVLNHADHLFWLGGSVADIVINLRTAGAEHTAKRRFVEHNTVIPIPLANPVGQISRRDARRTLGIGEEQVMLLSVGRDLKYRPCGSFDFVATANKILDHQPNAHLYVVGESTSGIAPYLRSVLHDRLYFLGSVEDPSLYRAAADVYLESFPFGSQTALLEAALSGLPVVPAYAPLFPLLVANDDAVLDLLPNPHDEQEYIERVELLIREPDQRVALGNALRERLLSSHVDKGWLDRLARMYQETDHLKHSPRQIPTSVCDKSDADIGLSLWNVMADGKTSSKDILADGVGAMLCHTAFVAKEAGDYSKARRFAWRAVCHDPYQPASWRLLAIAVLGRAGRLIRWMLNRS